jgi:hypothetical protein
MNGTTDYVEIQGWSNDRLQLGHERLGAGQELPSRQVGPLVTPADLLLWLTIATALVSLLAGAYRLTRAHFARQARIEGLLEHTERRSRQLETNGGSHIADQLNRMDSKLDGVIAEQAASVSASPSSRPTPASRRTTAPGR